MNFHLLLERIRESKRKRALALADKADQQRRRHLDRARGTEVRFRGFHGTDNEFETPDHNKSKYQRFYSTNSAQIAGRYGNNVMTVSGKMRNPYYDRFDRSHHTFDGKAKGKPIKKLIHVFSRAKLDQIKAAGHDGVIRDDGQGNQIYVAFSDTPLKRLKDRALRNMKPLPVPSEDEHEVMKSVDKKIERRLARKRKKLSSVLRKKFGT